VTYDWYNSPANEYTLYIYSLHKNVKIYDMWSKNKFYNMDGKSPSGFKNSSFCGMDCYTKPNPSPDPSPDPTPSDQT